MISNHFKTALRNIGKQPVFSVINILGLAIATACVLFIFLWVKNELSFDKFHQNSHKISRVIMNMGQHGNLALTPPPLINKIKDEFPEVVNVTRIQDCPKTIIKNENIIFYEEGGIFADPAFFEMFSFELVKGDNSNLLNDPSSIIITESMAKKYFQADEVINKTLSVNGHLFRIAGVLKDISQNSHLRFSYVLPINFVVEQGNDLNDWGDVCLYSYLETEEGVDFEQLNSKIKKLNTPRDETFFLQPLEDIHGETTYIADNAIVSNRTYISIFIAIALFILLIASINYISIYVSSSFNRAREIGIRKVIGSKRKNILVQFMIESLVYIVAALVIAIVLVTLLLPQFSNIIDKQLSFTFQDIKLIGSLLLLVILLLVLTGLYPAILFSSMKPSSILKNNKGKLGLLPKLKNIMVLVQFSVTTVLIIGIFTVSKQLEFIQNKDLGFEKENIIYMPFNGLAEHYESFKNELLKNPSVVNITAKNSLPVETADKTDDISWPDKNPDEKILVEATAVDYNYVETLGLHMVEGRSFSKEHSTDQYGLILNQEAVKQMGLKNPVGKKIDFWGYSCTILGVVNDALFYSLKEKVGPQILYMIQDKKSEEMAYNGVLLMRVKGSDMQETLTGIQTAWKKFYQEVPFSFHFLDQTIDNKYREDQQLFTVLKYFMFLSILISCLGLFGMSLFSARQRVKEIGIRKVNGAKITEIMTLLNLNFIKWVIVAFIIAGPFAFYVMNKWLEDFAYKTSISWWIFALTALITISIAFLTISWQSWRAARRNPVEALRYE